MRTVPVDSHKTAAVICGILNSQDILIREEALIRGKCACLIQK